jgi:glyoxylase-like metal-dependent hydrolase (beta-lactamase superfamily II)
VFDCGEILVPNLGKLMSPGIDIGVSKLLFVPCYLVEHPKGRLVWDAGLPDSLTELGDEGQWAGDRDFHSVVKRTLRAQLDEMNIDPSNIEFVAFSHLHFDHTGNGMMFSNARWLVQEAEFEAGFTVDAREHFFDPDTYGGLKNRAVKLNGDHDVFGDGSVVILSAPGHTPGHQVLFLDLSNYGPVILSGDLWHTTRKSMERIAAILLEKGAALWIEHDKVQYPDVPLAPDFVD